MVVYTCNPSSWEAEAGEAVSLKPAWGTHKPLFQKTKQKTGKILSS